MTTITTKTGLAAGVDLETLRPFVQQDMLLSSPPPPSPPAVPATTPSSDGSPAAAGAGATAAGAAEPAATVEEDVVGDPGLALVQREQEEALSKEATAEIKTAVILVSYKLKP